MWDLTSSTRNSSVTDEVMCRLLFRELRSASEIREMILNHARSPKPSLATVSGILHRLVKNGRVLRCKGFGPRGGYGYVRKMGAR